MADALSDIAQFTNMFSQFAGSVKQLHDVRVQAQAEAKAMQINEANYRLLQRWNLPAGDPNRLSLDPGSPSYWRTALEAQQAEVESYLGSVKDPTIQAGVRKQLEGSTRQFALAMSDKMAEAELVNTQEAKVQTLQSLMNLGQDDAAIEYYEKNIKAIQLFSPEKDAKLYGEMILPLKGRKIANDAQAKDVTGAVPVSTTERVVDGEVVGMDTTYEEIPVRKVNIREAMDDVAGRDMPMDEKGAALSILAGRMKEVEAQASVFMEDVKNRQAQGFIIDSGEYFSTVAGYAGNVSDEKMNDLMSPFYKGIKMSGLTGIDNFLGVVYAKAGAMYDPKTGKLSGGTKKIDPVEGLVMIENLRANFSEAAAGNQEVADKLQEAENKIRALMAEGGVESDQVFDAQWNHLFAAYKTRTGNVDGGTLVGYLFSHSHLISAEKMSRLYDDVAKGEMLDPKVRDIMSSDGMKKTFMAVAGDKVLGDASDAAYIADVLAGKKESAGVYMAFQNTMADVYNRIIKGENITPAQAQEMVAREAISFMKDYKAKAFEALKTGGDATYQRNLAKMAMQVSGRTYTTDLGGGDMTPGHIRAIQRNVDVLNTNVLAEVEGMDVADFVAVKGPSGEYYYTSPKWGQTAYKAIPSDSGFDLVEMTTSSMKGMGEIVKGLQKNGMGSEFVQKPRTKPIRTLDYAGKIIVIPPQYESPYSYQSELYGFKEGRLEP